MISFFLAVYIFAKPKSKPVPEWFQNYRTVYPNKEYLAQRGSGSSAEEARTDAMSALARYFQTTVNANLTTRETEVLTLLAEGLTNVEIAKKLNISVNTTKVHVCSILHKLEVNDRTQAAIKAIKHNII